MKFPFVFSVNNKFIVKIADYVSLTKCNTEWMMDSDLPENNTYALGIDLVQETCYKFDTLLEARNFIKDWWKEN